MNQRKRREGQTTRATLNSIQFLNKFSPMYISIISNEVHCDHKYSHRTRSIWVWIFILFNVTFQLTHTAGQTLWYISKWTTYTKYHMQDGITCIAVLCSAINSTNCIVTMWLHRESVWILLNRSIKLLEQLNIKSGRNQSENKVSVLIYSIRLLCLFGSFLWASIPFVLTSEPYQAVFGNNLMVKLSAMAIYGWTGLYTVGVLAALVTVCANISYTLIRQTSLLNLKQDTKIFVRKRHHFKEMWGEVEKVRVLLAQIKITFGMFLTTLAQTGVLHATAVGYIVLAMFNQMPFVFYVSAVFVEIAILMVFISFTNVAGKIVVNISGFKKHWRSMESVSIQKTIRALPTVGFQLGAYGTTEAIMGLGFCLQIGNNVINLLLIH